MNPNPDPDFIHVFPPHQRHSFLWPKLFGRSAWTQEGVALLDCETLLPVGSIYVFRLKRGRNKIHRFHSVLIYVVRIQRWFRRCVLPLFDQHYSEGETVREWRERHAVWKEEREFQPHRGGRLIYI